MEAADAAERAGRLIRRLLFYIPTFLLLLWKIERKRVASGRTRPVLSVCLRGNAMPEQRSAALAANESMMK